MTTEQTVVVSTDYILGFDGGYSYALAEIEVFIKAHDHDPRFFRPIEILLAHLKSKGGDIPVH